MRGLLAPAIVGLSVLVAPIAAQAQSTPATPPNAAAAIEGLGAPNFGECESAVDDAALRAELTERARAAMRAATADLDYEPLVRDSWEAARFDEKFERIVDDKIEILRADRPYLERLLDGNIPSRAEEMATRTAELVFQSPEFAELQQDLQNEIAARLEPLVAEADAEVRSRAAACVQTFLGARYAQTVQAAFAEDIEALSVGGDLGTGDVSTSVALNLAGVVAAILAVVFRRLVRRIVASVVRRLAGAIAARLAAWASIVLGVAFLIYELIAGADGVFPVIRSELLSDETRIEIQTALVDELSSVGPEQLEARAATIAETMFVRWRDFKDNHRAVLALAEAEPRFRGFLQDQPPGRFEAITAVVAALKQEGGDAAVLDALDRGVLAEAIRLPDVAIVLDDWARRGVRVETLVDWRALAGDGFSQVLAYGLPEIVTPDAVTRAEIAAALALDDRRAARLAVGLDPAARSEVLALSPDATRSLAARFDVEEVDALLQLLRPITGDARRAELLTRVVTSPDMIRRVSHSSADAVSASASPSAAVELLLDAAPMWSPLALYGNARSVFDGEVAPMVAVHRYGWWLIGVLGLPLLIAWWLVRSVLRPFFPRRQTVTVKVEPPSSGAA